MASEWYLTEWYSEWSNDILNGTYKKLFSFFINGILNGIPFRISLTKKPQPICCKVMCHIIKLCTSPGFLLGSTKVVFWSARHIVVPIQHSTNLGVYQDNVICQDPVDVCLGVLNILVYSTILFYTCDMYQEYQLCPQRNLALHLHLTKKYCWQKCT